jgi:hypothetical protein
VVFPLIERALFGQALGGRVVEPLTP